MPIAVTCPGCSVNMKAPDAAAGKKVKCPKCQALITVPGSAQFEVVDESPPAAKRPSFGGGSKPAIEVAAAEVEEEEKPKPKAKRLAAEDDDDEDDKPRKKTRDQDDDEDERPTKKKNRKRDEDDEEGGSRLVRNIIGVVLLVIMVGLAGFVFYDKFVKKDEDKPLASNDSPAPQPGGNASSLAPGAEFMMRWQSYVTAEEKFVMKLPIQATKIENWKTRDYHSEDRAGGWAVLITVMDVEEGASISEERKKLEERAVQALKKQKAFNGIQQKEVSYLGQTVNEVTIQLANFTSSNDVRQPGTTQTRLARFRVLSYERKIYLVEVECPENRESDMNAVLNTFVFTK
jgi:hypothetical protein